ncbi:hypothetical protein [Pseudoalteromonas undina]|uniref:Uncharacterized protein n=1 Tax=Pseudoalteromonas undina TaxID=43660 RepID=A0ACC6R128_9GAMM
MKVGKQTTGIATINKTVFSEFVPFIPSIELQDKYLKVHLKIKSLFIGRGGNCSLVFNLLGRNKSLLVDHIDLLGELVRWVKKK